MLLLAVWAAHPMTDEERNDRQREAWCPTCKASWMRPRDYTGTEACPRCGWAPAKPVIPPPLPRPTDWVGTMSGLSPMIERDRELDAYRLPFDYPHQHHVS